MLLQAKANPCAVRPGGTSALMDAAAGGHEARSLEAAEAPSKQLDSAPPIEAAAP